MVAFAGGAPIGVLIGAKRPAGTLIHKIAVHPDHVRQGHGRHLLESLGSKLAILGPPRIVAEVPETLTAVCGLFEAAGYLEEAVLTDYALEPGGKGPGAGGQGALGYFVIPVTVDDLEANGLLGDDLPHPWERSVETLAARKTDIAGLAVASDERIEAYILYVQGEILALRSLVEHGGERLTQLLSRLQAQGVQTLRVPKVHPAEISKELLERLGFRSAGGYRLYAATAKA